MFLQVNSRGGLIFTDVQTTEMGLSEQIVRVSGFRNLDQSTLSNKQMNVQF